MLMISEGMHIRKEDMLIPSKGIKQPSEDMRIRKEDMLIPSEGIK